MARARRSRRPKTTTVPPLEMALRHPDAAGIDVGSTFHCVAIPPDRAPESVRTFGVYTPDLLELVAWLRQCRITTVALEATGVYWIPLYEVLQAAGLQVTVVNPLYVRRMRDVKTDVADSVTLLQLHTFGQLPASFRPTLDISALQSYWRLREGLVQKAADAVRHMQKALDLMNVHLHKAIADLAGKTGLRIVRAIVGGECDPEVLARMKESRMKCAHDELVRALTGHYQAEHLFALRLALEDYDLAQVQIVACDVELSAYLATLPDGDRDDATAESVRPAHPVRRQGNMPTTFDLTAEVLRLTGRDFTPLPGVSTLTVMTGIAEVGLDLTRWATERQFASWLGLSPNRKITGGRVISSCTRNNTNRFATALRLAAQSLLRSQTALGAEFRQLRARLGPAKAITAMARKLAVLYYRLMRYGQAYVDTGQAAYEAQHRERSLKYLHKRAQALGLELVDPSLAA